MLAQTSCDGNRDKLKPGGPKRDLTLTQLSFFKTFARGRTGSVAPCLVGSIGTVGALVTSVSRMHTPPTLNTAKLIWGTSRFVYEINKKDNFRKSAVCSGVCCYGFHTYDNSVHHFRHHSHLPNHRESPQKHTFGHLHNETPKLDYTLQTKEKAATV